jgi:hypothetical protein
MIEGRASGLRLLRWQQWPKPLPLLISQLSTVHTSNLLALQTDLSFEKSHKVLKLSRKRADN